MLLCCEGMYEQCDIWWWKRRLLWNGCWWRRRCKSFTSINLLQFTSICLFSYTRTLFVLFTFWNYQSIFYIIIYTQLSWILFWVCTRCDKKKPWVFTTIFPEMAGNVSMQNVMYYLIVVCRSQWVPRLSISAWTNRLWHLLPWMSTEHNLYVRPLSIFKCEKIFICRVWISHAVIVLMHWCRWFDMGCRYASKT